VNKIQLNFFLCSAEVQLFTIQSYPDHQLSPLKQQSQNLKYRNLKNHNSQFVNRQNPQIEKLKI